MGSINMPEALVEVPKEKSHGDYVSNVSFGLAKVLKRNPNDIALLLKSQVEKNEMFKKVEVVGGFINFFIKDKLFYDELKNIDKNFGKNDLLKNNKIMVEYTDPNILKEFHIGHVMSNTIGESISRLFEFYGANVRRVCYQSDVGLGIAKAVFGKMKNPDLSWQDAYVFGTKTYDENEVVKKEITELNKKIFEHSDKAVNKLYDQGKKWSLESFDRIYKKLGTKFDYYFLESGMVDLGKKAVDDGLKKGILEKGEKGAIIFKGEKLGLHTRVFINSEGLPTYEAKELALAQVKYSTYKYDTSVIITGNEVNEYFAVLQAAMMELFFELWKKTMHFGHGMMRLPDGKMSSRTGKIITFEALLKDVEKLVEKKIAGREFSEKEKKEVAEKVAIGALKYSILKQSVGSDIIFDFEKSISFEGDSGPYLQYSLARASSVLKKAKAEKVKASFKKTPAQIGQLEKTMVHFPEVIVSASPYSPHSIVTYLTELAREFNNYYAQNKIVDKEHKNSSAYNVAVTGAFAQIMKNGLWLLGIPVPEKM